MSSARELGWPRRDVMVMIYEEMESKGRSEENDIAGMLLFNEDD